MREPFTQLYVHLVWATWDRLPLLSPELLEVVDRAVRHECVALGVKVEAFGGVADICSSASPRGFRSRSWRSR